MYTPDSTIIILQLLFTLLPSIGVLAFLLLNRRQHIQAELDDLRMRQEYRTQQRLQETAQVQAVSEAVQAYAPAITAFVELQCAKRSKPLTAADLSDEDLVVELRRRADGAFCDLDECEACGEHSPSDADVSNPIN